MLVDHEQSDSRCGGEVNSSLSPLVCVAAFAFAQGKREPHLFFTWRGVRA
jgi:hypothetical protein